MKLNSWNLLFFLLFVCESLSAQINVVANIQNANVGSASWIKLGTLSLPQGGYNASIKINSGTGYNARLDQMGVTEIYIRTSNSSITQNGFAFSAYAYRTGYTKAINAIKILPNASGTAATAYDIYIYNNLYIGGSLYEVTAGTGSWTRVEAASTDPGANAYNVPFNYKILNDISVDTTLYVTTATSRVGVGAPTPGAKLHVSTDEVAIARFNKSSIPVTDGVFTIGNATNNQSHYIPSLIGRSYCPTRPHGMVIIAEADDIVPPANDNLGAALVLDGRSKNTSRLNNNNVLAVHSYGTPLLMVKANGALCINTIDPKGYMLAVNGSGIFTKVVVKNSSNWPDYVFDKNYQLPSIQELENYINKNNRLPDIPSANDIASKGLDLAEMQKLQMQKIEELTLYMIQLNKQIAAQQQIIQQQQELLDKLQAK
ncbi:hypothetical protein SAMN05660909_01275 [Chitinophaga terrae (ex Kim and Jung 2007)]|uniref:Uncharacterized protein n=1 Tax=Chitinophaga terrae (ex Kim and Jung 2007) TaxID=408074 RepID=A0A1H3ZM37_9BACT|nr:hypothetical protein [Chitinophaga terrae (ex Kim and Jung 2007)]GEP88803.1 hypothetical protein CTE07_04480 [Chitinophaga terrae (ex Kim and Jung 2007)]SEA24262.1 hypothetical protein SAMN05660909_01275 [Chitinophaga terrae (ex Kim and Jung 2007)]